jgi:hypothetical protein
MQMTERSAKWMEGVVANCEKNTGRSLEQWARLARGAKLTDAGQARAWARDQGLSIVYATAVTQALFSEATSGDDEALVEGQYSGPKAALRPIYEAVVKAARKLGADVEVMPRKSQVTLSREKSFAVLRAAAKDRVEVLLKLSGTVATKRLVAIPKAMTSDPTHVVRLHALKEVDRELTGWLRAAYQRAGAGAGSKK